MTLGPAFEGVLEAAKLGSDWAWAALYGETAGPLIGFFRSRGATDPEEAAGDVFFELARTLTGFEGNEESFRTFVFVIAYKRLLLDKQHPTRRRRSVLADEVLDRVQRDVEVRGSVTGDRVPEEVRSAFEVLTPEQRDVLSLRIVAGLSVEQVAEVIGQGVRAVKTAQRKGLARIRQQMPDGVSVA